MPTGKKITNGLVGCRVFVQGPGCGPKGCEAYIRAVCPCGKQALIGSCCGEWQDRWVLVSQMIVSRVY